MSQVRDPLLAKHFRWDAQRLYKYDGTEWVRFYDEPWTAENFSKAQVRNNVVQAVAVLAQTLPDSSRTSQALTRTANRLLSSFGRTLRSCPPSVLKKAISSLQGRGTCLSTYAMVFLLEAEGL